MDRYAPAGKAWTLHRSQRDIQDNYPCCHSCQGDMLYNYPANIIHIYKYVCGRYAQYARKRQVDMS